ncbi:hypothetical protein ACXHXG_24335 [Rhizobium sp. LEGMi198b]
MTAAVASTVAQPEIKADLSAVPAIIREPHEESWHFDKTGMQDQPTAVSTVWVRRSPQTSVYTAFMSTRTNTAFAEDDKSPGKLDDQQSYTTPWDITQETLEFDVT